MLYSPSFWFLLRGRSLSSNAKFYIKSSYIPTEAMTSQMDFTESHLGREKTLFNVLFNQTNIKGTSTESLKFSCSVVLHMLLKIRAGMKI